MLKFFLIINITFIGLIVLLHYVQFRKNKKIYAINGTNPSEGKDGLSAQKYMTALLELKAVAQSEENSATDQLTADLWESNHRNMLQILVDYYRGEALKRHILFMEEISAQLTSDMVQDYHLIHIAGNLLQNALEALENLPDSQVKQMGIWIDCEDGEICLRVHNSYPEALCAEADLNKWCTPGYSTKGSEERGQGLPLLNRLVKQQDGVIYLDTEKGVSFIVEFAV